MASSKNRLPTGKLANTVSYPLNGKMVTRSIGLNTKKRSKLQLAVMQKTKVTSGFLNSVLPYIKIGYGIEAQLQKLHPQNPAFVYHWHNALKGEYPHLEIDYQKVLLTKGILPKPEGVFASLVEDGLSFSWNPEVDQEPGHWTDQVMMIAYFPKTGKTQFVSAGANRHIGHDLLFLTYQKENAVMELYLSFISSRRDSISNSVYAGQLYW